MSEGSDFESQRAAAEEQFQREWKRGPTRTRWTDLPPQVGDPAPALRVQEATGAKVNLSAFWDDGPALLLFWRHFGCSCGLARAERLKDEYPRYVEAGASVVLVTMGEPARAVDYARKRDLPCAVVCDPDQHLYKAYGLLQGTPAQVLYDAPEDLKSREDDASRELLEQRRARDQHLVDDPWQLPGDFVVDEEGVIRLAYRSQYCEDFPDPRVLTTAIEQARRRSSQG